MSVAFVWHSFGPDSFALALSIRSWAENFAQPGDEFTVCEEEGNPITPTVRAALAVHYGVRFLQRPAMHNLNGPGAPQRVLRALAAASGGHEAVWKVDSDALCFGARHRALMERARPALLGSPWIWRGQSVARGFAYCLASEAIAAVLPCIVEFSRRHGPPEFDEDAVISACVAQVTGRPPLLPPYDPSGLWAGWNFDTNQPPARYHQTFDLVTFGNPPCDRARRDATMRRVYDDFRATRTALTAGNR